MQNSLNNRFTPILRKLLGFFWDNPEFRFLGNILLGILALGIIYLIFRSKF
jgi:hypothetical protein